MPKAIVNMIASETMNAAAAANTGSQRDVIQSRIGNSRATVATGSHGSGGSETMMTVITANTTSATTPSRGLVARRRPSQGFDEPDNQRRNSDHANGAG